MVPTPGGDDEIHRYRPGENRTGGGLVVTEHDDCPELKGIVASDEFRRYIADFRQTLNALHDENGFPQPKNRGLTFSKMSSKPTSDSIDRRMMTRRGAMKAGAGAAVSLTAIGAGAGNVVTTERTADEPDDDLSLLVRFSFEVAVALDRLSAHTDHPRETRDLRGVSGRKKSLESFRSGMGPPGL